jgi:hypothetical protein
MFSDTLRRAAIARIVASLEQATQVLAHPAGRVS